MLGLDEETRRKAALLGAAALNGDQPPPADQKPDTNQSAQTDQQTDATAKPAETNTATASGEERKLYETRRADLIKIGGVKLDKILTHGEYADVRKHFGLDDPALVKKQIATLDPASRKEIHTKTLRDVVTLDRHNDENPQFLPNGPMLKRFFTNSNDIDTQIKDATGQTATRYDAIGMGEDEKSLRKVFREEMARQGIEKGPELYIHYGEGEPAVSQAVLKDGKPIMLVNLDTWKSDPEVVTVQMKNRMEEAHYAEHEIFDAYRDRYKNTPLKDVLTKPEFAYMRDALSLPDLSGKTDADFDPKYLDKLDPASRKFLDKQTLNDAITTTWSSPDHNGYKTYEYPSIQDSLIYPLIPPEEHVKQIEFFLNIGDFGKNKGDKENTATLVDPSSLTGEEKEFYGHYADMATNPKKMGLDKPPELYYLDYDTGNGASTTLLKDGTRVIVLDKSTAEMDPKERLSVIGHEDGHLFIMKKKGYKSIYDIMKENSSEKASIRNELEADSLGMGRRGTNDAPAFGKVFEDLFSTQDGKKYKMIVDMHLESLAMGNLTHPLPDDRFKAIRKETHDQEVHADRALPYYPRSKDQGQSRQIP
jgi:hypothetical protein